MSVTTLTPDGKARELERIAQVERQLAAAKAEVVAAFARDRTMPATGRPARPHPDGVLSVTAASGVTRTTRPPGMAPPQGPAPPRQPTTHCPSEQ